MKLPIFQKRKQEDQRKMDKKISPTDLLELAGNMYEWLRQKPSFNYSITPHYLSNEKLFASYVFLSLFLDKKITRAQAKSGINILNKKIIESVPEEIKKIENEIQKLNENKNKLIDEIKDSDKYNSSKIEKSINVLKKLQAELCSKYASGPQLADLIQ